MTDTKRLMRQSQDRITGADLLATWSERLGGNVGMSLNEFLKWVQANGGIDAVLAEADRAIAEAELATATANAANAAANLAVETANTAIVVAEGSVTLAEDAATQAAASAAVVEDTKEKLDSIDQGDVLVDGGASILTLEATGDLIRMYSDGLDLDPSQRAVTRVFDKGMVAGSMGIDGGAVIETLNDGTPIRKLYADGMDFIPSQLFTARLPPSLSQAGQHGVSAVDQLIERDGVKYPVSSVNGVTRKAIIISIYGQSNADITPMADGLFWDTPPYPYNAFMLNDISGSRGGIKGWGGIAAPAAPGLANASELASDTMQSYGSVAFAKLIQFDTNPRRVGVVRASGLGGEPLIGVDGSANEGLWKTDLGDYTVPWLNWQQDIVAARNLLVAEGYEVEAVYICFTHQEADAGKAAGVYLGQLNGFKTEKEALLATDLPGVPVQWFVDQASGSGYRTPTYQGGAWPDRMDIADFAAAHANVTMVCPRYWMPFWLEQGSSDLANAIHHAHRPRIRQGELFGLAMREIEAGRGWDCASPASWSISGNSVIINFNSLTPLVLDPTFCKVRPDMGFQLRTVSTITYPTSVTLTGPRQVTVTFSSPPTVGAFIRYAYRGIEAGDSALSNNPADPYDTLNVWPLSTGALRESWIADSQFDPGNPLVRAALGFEKVLS